MGWGIGERGGGDEIYERVFMVEVAGGGEQASAAHARVGDIVEVRGKLVIGRCKARGDAKTDWLSQG